MSNNLHVIRLFLVSLGLILFVITSKYLDGSKYQIYLTFISLGLVGLSSFISVYLSRCSFKNRYPEDAKTGLISTVWQSSILVGLALYLFYENSYGGGEKSISKYVIIGTWITFVVMGAFLALGVELGRLRSGNGEAADFQLVSRFAVKWVSIGFLGLSLAGLNYLAVKTDRVIDASYLKVSNPGEGTKEIVSALAQKLDVEIFYRRDNIVLPYVLEYFAQLKSPLLELKIFDREINPLQAEKARVSRNGQVVLRLGDRVERIIIGQDLKKANSNLRKLDRSFQTSIQRLVSKKKVVYFTVGHGEMATLRGDNVHRSLKATKKILKSQNFIIKQLVANKGAFIDIPKETDLLIIAAPTQSFSQFEADVIEGYIRRGGSLFILIDRENINVLDGVSSIDYLIPMLGKMGIKFHEDRIANETKYVSLTSTNADRWFGYTDHFLPHEATESLIRFEDQVKMVFRNSSYLEVRESVGWKASALYKTYPDSFPDTNLNSKFDKESEKRGRYTLAIATEAVTENGGRVLAVSDGSVISDFLMSRNVGNQVLFLDAIRWLTGDISIVSSQSSEEDVRIVHRRGKHLYVFFGSIVVVPLMVLVFGLIVTRSRSKKGVMGG